MSHYGFIDDLIKEYLIFRGFTSSLKSFESELKAEKEKGFRVDRLLDTFLSYVNNQDLNSLRDLWGHLSSRYFSRLDGPRISGAQRLESGLLKFYLVSCVQSRHSEKVREFFERMTPELQGISEWREWFTLPYVKNPEENPVFAHYFSRSWQDTLFLSLYNFLSLLYSSLPPPRLAEFQNTSIKLRKLREDNEAMRRKILSLANKGTNGNYYSSEENQPPFRLNHSPPNVMDDFYIIAQEAPANNQPSKSLKNFLKNFTATNSSSSATSSSKTTNSAKLSSPAGTGPQALKKKSPNSRHVPVKRVVAVPSVPSVPAISDINAAAALMDDALKEPPPGGGLAYLPLSHGEFSEHRSEVTQVRFAAMGRIIASGDVDGIIKVWSPSPEDPKTLSTFISKFGITSLDWVGSSEKNFLYGNKNGVVRLCDRIDRNFFADSTVSKNNPILHLTSSLSGSTFAVSTGAENSSLSSFYIYDLKTFKVIAELSAVVPIPMITCSVYNHNATMTIAGGVDGKIRVFDLRRNDCIASWSTKDSVPITTLQLSMDENSIYALSQDGHFSEWSLTHTGNKISEQTLMDSYFNEGAYARSAWGKQFALSGKHLLCCSISGGVIYEKTPSLVKVLGLKGHECHATCVDWSLANDGGPCITADVNGRIRGWTLLSQ